MKVHGQEVVGASRRELRELRSHIGMIFQTFNLVNRTTVINNVLMGRLSKVPVVAFDDRLLAARRQGIRITSARTRRDRREGVCACL